MISTSHYSAVICVGNAFYEWKKEFPFHFFITTNEAAQWWHENESAGHTILVKGSRGMTMEKMKREK